MEHLLQDLTRWLIAAGPIVVLVITMSETAIFIGLLVPAEAAVLFAGFLAGRGVFELTEVVFATVLGGFTGDQIGYALGRFGGSRMRTRDGRLGRLWASYEPQARRLFARRSILSISGARFVSFVRTLMPWFAGMSRIGYGRFVIFDFLGVAGWAVASIAVGFLAGESWQRVAGALGTTSAAILALLIIGLALYVRRRKTAELLTATDTELQAEVEAQRGADEAGPPGAPAHRADDLGARADASGNTEVSAATNEGSASDPPPVS